MHHKEKSLYHQRDCLLVM